MTNIQLTIHSSLLRDYVSMGCLDIEEEEVKARGKGIIHDLATIMPD